MTELPTEHATFAIARSYRAPPAKVFAAWATREAKSRWFNAPADRWTEKSREFDFRVGGREHLSGTWQNGTVSAFDAVYHDIVPDRRIVYSYAMRIDGKRISVSLATVEFAPAGEGTRLVVTEQGAFLDGYADDGSREQGTGSLLDRLAATLQGRDPPA